MQDSTQTEEGRITEMLFEDAMKKRWEEGVSHYRPNPSSEWVGDPPLLEAYEELVDCANYVREAERQGQVSSVSSYYLEHQIRELAMTIKDIFHNVEAGTVASEIERTDEPD